jgi:hypothetical protein
MARLRTPAAPEPAAVNVIVGARRFRWLRAWIQLAELGLGDDRTAELLTIGALPDLLDELDKSGLGDRASAHVDHLEAARDRWPGGRA